MNISTTEQIYINYCGRSKPSNLIPSLDQTAITLNSISLLINILHVIVLSQMKSLKNTPYRAVLYNIAFSDIYYGLSELLRLLRKREYFPVAFIPWIIVFNTVTNGGLMARYWLMAASTTERFVAVCRPMRYSTSAYINYLHFWMIPYWIAPILLSLSKEVIDPKICLTYHFGPLNLGSKYAPVIIYLSEAIPLLFACIALTLVIIELWKMKKRSLSEHEKEVMRATLYVVVITGILVVFMMYPLIQQILITKKLVVHGMFYVGQLIYAFYGIVNTVIYGAMTPAYRRQIQIMFRRDENAIMQDSGATMSTTV